MNKWRGWYKGWKYKWARNGSTHLRWLVWKGRVDCKCKMKRTAFVDAYLDFKLESTPRLQSRKNVVLFKKTAVAWFDQWGRLIWITHLRPVR